MHLERLDNFLQKMDRSFNRSGFSYSPNTEALDLENHLGIKFSEIPLRVDMNFRNRMVLFTHFLTPPITTSNSKLHLVFAALSGNWRGIYIPGLDIYFAQDDSPFVGHHENMHGYVDTVDPDLEKRRLGLLVNQVIQGLGRKAPKADNGEDVTILKCFDEGVAQWGAVRTGLKMGGSQAEEASSMHNLMMVGERIPGSLLIDKDYVFTQFQLIQESLGGLKGLSSKAETATYITGYYFMTRAMGVLSRRSLSIPQAIDLLIKNPPENFEELKHPKDYAGSLI